MAIMYPEHIDSHNTDSPAEIFMFNEFKKQLDDSFHIFHSMTWTGNRNIQGECDFVIFKRDTGFITLEVKGGSIEVIDNNWYSVNRHNQRLLIKDPVKQARYAQYAFRDLYRASAGEYFTGIFSWGVCFPECKIDTSFLHRELNQKNILHLGNIDRMYNWIMDLFSFTRPNHRGKISDDQANGFLSLFNTNMRFSRSILFSMKKQEEELEMVNHFQEYMLNLFDDKKRVGFQGAAGTGKTWIALKKVMRLADAGNSILFLCFSSNLRTYISQKLAGLENVTVDTFHSFAIRVISDFMKTLIDHLGISELFDQWMHGVYVKAGEPEYFEAGDYQGFLRWLSTIECLDCRQMLDSEALEGFDNTLREVVTQLIPEAGSSGSFYAARLPKALSAIFNEYTLRDQFDAIVIDEAQDFEDEWCECINYFYKNQQDRVIYIFYDDNQSIFRKNETLPVVGLLNTGNLGDYIFHLKNNLRNTSAIHFYAVHKTGLGATAKPMDVEGIEPEEYSFSNGKEALDCVESIALTLLEEHGINRTGVTILSNVSRDESIFRSRDLVAGYRLESEVTTQSKGIRYRTISQFKGLESDVIILVLDYLAPAIEEHHSISPELIYVGCTRARYVLYVVEVGKNQPAD